ncbi:hypothetical protein [Geotalea uraniireducens]|uniref:Uncharacterized protein n=1 Tax=Geotalea uraniireducens (strain Rf4) TaxID=351605 RepID=A5G4C1_GEOUR|nr:hypothetical protein [Geotalea uraniireducens]ABQ26639.1 hypothetical protein Gura_2460 [Geotalea uraniireducens Rf4]
MITDQSEWKVKASLKPGQKGTLKQYEEFGDKLFCVRYRYKDGFRIKTVEISQGL